jgi:adenylate cyclase
MKKQKLIKKLTAAVLITVVTTILATALASLNPLNKWQLKLTNHLYNRNAPSDEIVIVAIDEGSLDEDSGLGKWQDWDRSYYGEAIENLNKKGASTIAVDLVFSEESQGISKLNLEEILLESSSFEDAFKTTVSYTATPHPEDEAFAEILEKYGNTIIAKSHSESNGPNIKPEEPIAIIAKNTYAASALAYSDDDEVFRRTYPYLYNLNIEEWEPNFSVKTIELHLGETPAALENNLVNDQLIVNFAAPPYSFTAIPFVDAYYNYLDEIDLKDKIVLIGPTADRFKDTFLTPTSTSVPMPGVEFRANEIQTILEGSYLLEQSVAGQAVMIALLTLILTAAVMFLPIFGGVAATIVIIAGHQFSAQTFFNNGLILNLVYPTLALLAAYLATTLYKFVTEVREKKQIKGAFGKYVNKDLANKILDNPEALKLGGDRRTITVFFSDIANFTNFSEKSEPEALVAQLNEYFEVMAGVILRNNGNLNKFEGDAIMAFWGAPLDQPNHAVLAAKSALECRAALTQLHQKWQQAGKPLLNFRVGLSTGDAIAGNVGSSERFDYTVMGDIVNLGSRLESANKEYGTHVMIPDATVSQLGDAFELRRLDKLRVKGKDEPVDVFELMALKGQLTDQHRTIIDQFHQAIEYYRNQKFAEAEARFNEVLLLAPNDGPTKVYIARCKHFQNSPPQGFDGTWTLDHK